MSRLKCYGILASLSAIGLNKLYCIDGHLIEEIDEISLNKFHIIS